MGKRICFFCVITITLFLSACSSPQPMTAVAPTAARGADYSGSSNDEGNLTLDDGARMYIPPGAASELNVHFERLETPPTDLPPLPEQAVTLGSFYDITSNSGELQYPATVVLPYDPEPLQKLGISDDEIKTGMYLAFPNGQDWKRVYGVVDQQNHTFTALLSNLEDPILMWDFYDPATIPEPWIGPVGIKSAGEWHDSNEAPAFPFKLNNGAFIIDQPVTLGLVDEWKAAYFECAAKEGISPQAAARWKVYPVIVLQDGRRLPLDTTSEAYDLTLDKAAWRDNIPYDYKATEIQLTFNTPLAEPASNIRAIGFYVVLKGLKVDKNGCHDEVPIQDKYFELPLVFTANEMPPVSGTRTPVPTPTLTFTPQAFSPTPTLTTDSGGPPRIGLANPASVYCQNQGNKSVTRTDATGGQYGICIFPDGSECEEWAYYNGQCGPGGGSSMAQRYVGAYAIGEYTRAENAPEADTVKVTVKRIEEVIAAVDDHTIRVQVRYEGDGKDLISTKPYTYIVDLLTGQITDDGTGGFSNPLSLGTLVNSGPNSLDYQVNYDEVVDGWTFEWTGTIQRDPSTYLLKNLARTGEVYDSKGLHWGNYIDTITLIEIKIP